MKKILNTYKKAFGRVLIFCLLCLFCVIASFVVVFPFYYLATLHKGIYTVLSLFIIITFFVFLIVRKIWKVYKASPRRLFLLFFKLALIVLGIVLFVFFATYFYKKLALASLVSAFLLYVVFVPPLTKWAEG